MRKKIIIAIYVVIVFIALRLVTEMPFILWYNHGNTLYNEERYIDAISAYDIALNLFPSKYKECKIRINMALAMIKTINTDYDINMRLNVLNNARDVLTDEGCANKDDDNGHSKEAEKLKKDIDKEIERLEKLITSGNGDSDNIKDNDTEQDNKDKNIQNNELEAKLDRLEEIQKQGVANRKQELERMQELNNSVIFYEGKNW